MSIGEALIATGAWFVLLVVFFTVFAMVNDWLEERLRRKLEKMDEDEARN